MKDYQNSWTIYQKALYHDKEDNWTKAHELIQDEQTPEAAWIHAYLHRKEGDEFNAGYWYRRAGKSFFSGTPEEEWNFLWSYFNK